MSKRIDAHNHAGIRYGARQTGEDLVRKLDEAGIDMAVIFPFVEGTFSNDPIAEYVAAYPDRLVGFCSVNPWDVDTAADEVRRRLGAGFRGIKLHPTIHGYHLSDHGMIDRIFEAAREHAVPVIVHGASDLYNSPLEMAEMARTFPEVPLLMAHMGTFWLFQQAIELARQLPNLYLETSRAPVFEITEAVKALGAGKVIFGTDSPFVDYAWEVQKMERVAETPEDYDLVMGGNIARLLGI